MTDTGKQLAGISMIIYMSIEGIMAFPNKMFCRQLKILDLSYFDSKL